jgi:hypothetical protein
MKRIISLVLAVSMVLSLCVTAFAAKKYTDLTGDNAKYAAAVEALTELGVIDGFTDNTFGPEKNLTRAQLAKMLVICLGLGDSVESLAGRTVFSDVEATHWAAGYINAAAQSKVITGYPDGTFKPEKEVTYAEAFTMALRALGYGNVVEAEGVWPTAYMLKAVELELTDDMEGTIVAGAPATRGNTAILLWNMLRTPMWRIYEESQGSGMTLTATNYMLNVKFPKYAYAEGVYLTHVDVNDQEVTAEVEGNLDDNNVLFDWDGSAKVPADTDVSRLVPGEKVTVLVKNYKDSEKAEFLTLTPMLEVVEGFVTSIENVADGKIKVNDVEYKLDSRLINDLDRLEENDFVVMQVDGKKIVGINLDNFAPFAALKVLPNFGEEIEKASQIKSKVDEDDLLIIDGVWATRDDVKEGDVISIIENDEFVTGKFVMVARERVTGPFESLTNEKDSEERMYFEVNGEHHKALYDAETDTYFFDAYKGKDNDEEIDPDDLRAKPKDNNYLDQEVELVLNYLHLVVTAYFGDVDAVNGGDHFYAVMSNGVREITDPETGDSTLKIRLANGEDPEGTMYEFTKNFVLEDFERTEIAKGETYRRAEEDNEGEVTFVWAKLNNKGQIKDIAVLHDGLESGDDLPYPLEYSDKHNIVAFKKEMDDGYIEDVEGQKFRISASTIVYKLTPVTDDEDDTVVGFKFEVAEDAKKALSGVDEGLIAYDTTDKINKNIRVANYVFIKEDAISSDLEAAKVESVKEQKGIAYVKLNGEWEEVVLNEDNSKSIVDDYDDVEDLIDNFIVFSRTEKEQVIPRYVLTPYDLIEASIVRVFKDNVLQAQALSDGELALDGDYDLDKPNSDEVKPYQSFQMVRVNASLKTKSFWDEDLEETVKLNLIEFDNGESLGQGLPAGKYAKGDRLVVVKDETNNLKAVFIVSISSVNDRDWITYDDLADDVVVFIAPKGIDYNEGDRPNDDDSDDDDDDDTPTTFAVSPMWADGTQDYVMDAVDLSALATTVESGETWTLVLDPYTFESGEHSGERFAFSAEPIDAVVEDSFPEVTATPSN